MRITIPSRFNCSPRVAASLTACAIPFPPVCSLSFRFRRGIIYFDLGLVAQRADYLEAAGDDLVAFIQTTQDLDIDCAGDPGLHFPKNRFLDVDDEYSLNLFLESLGLVGRRRRRALGIGIGLQVALLPYGQSLNGRSKHVPPGGGGTFGRTGEAGPDLVGWIVERDHHLEILGLLT